MKKELTIFCTFLVLFIVVAVVSVLIKKLTGFYDPMHGLAGIYLYRKVESWLRKESK